MATTQPADTTTMDEATRIVAELQAKLDELDLKVWRYRHDMAAEFNKYAQDILRDKPEDVSETVSKTFADKFTKYTSLNLSASGGIESRSIGDSDSSENIVPIYSTNTTTLLHSSDRSEGESEIPRSPHERDQEFVGVFTQPYLPLLGEVRQSERRCDKTLYPALDRGKQKEPEGVNGDAGIETRSLAASPDFRRPPTPRRKNTGDSVVSVTSDYSDGPIRRSALRQVSSNSANPQSPRRVRFDINGYEAPVSSSPAPKDAVSSELESHAFPESSDDEGDSEQIEDVDSPPAPKRISSSQRLRTLSRAPLDDDTNWTELKAPADGSASVAELDGTDDGSDDEGLVFGASNGNGKQRSASGTTPQPIPAGPTSHQTIDVDDTNDDVAIVSGYEDTLGMPPLRRTPRSEAVSMLSPIDVPNIDDNKTPTSATRSPSKPALDLEASTQASKEAQESKPDDIGDFFLFDDEEGKTGGPPDSQFDESDNESVPHPTEENTQEEPAIPVDNAPPTSPPIMNPMQHAPKPPTRPLSGVAGSYKGHPFGFPVASDEIQAQAASVNINSFVGSVNGNSGMDESDFQSFRESLRQGPVGSFLGEPKSMSERMMLEDLREEEKEKAAKGQAVTKP